MAAERPNPEDILRRVVEAERKERAGRLKVFLGYASRVGKTSRMLDEGRRRRTRGQDVVVGWVQRDKEDPQVDEILSQMEVMPPRPDGEMDVDAILARKPQVCLVDALAHTNPDGSRHHQRWEDVRDLLDAGINVVTTINVQYLSGLQDAVHALLGTRKTESVPDRFVLDADEVVLVDASQEALQERGQPDEVTHGKLQQLREMALLYTADAIEHQVEDYLQTHHIAAVWSTQERILVCVTSHVRGADLVEKGYRAAKRLHGELWAVYVTPDPDWSNLTREQRDKVESTLALARGYKAKVAVLVGTAVADTIIQFAKEHRISQIFIGHTLKRPFPHLLSQSTVGRIIRQAEGIDVHVVADPTPESEKPVEHRPVPAPAPAVPHPDKPRGRLKIYLGYAAGVGKTYQMLSDGRTARAAGHDVAVGYFESHGRPDTIAQLADLEVVPRRAMQYRNCEFQEMDFSAVLARRPEICLVDELAHTNVPGLEREKRWQDVSALLDAQINVWTTLNVQHLESLNDSVLNITGVRVRETVPDWFVDQADEIVFVDVATRALINRLHRGAVYPPEKAQEALKNFFREGNLNALRELAMRQTADAVEHTLQEATQTADNNSGDVVMVCLTERPSASALVRRGKRMADRLGAQCYVVYVVQDDNWKGVSPDARRLVEDHLTLARGLHMQTEVLVGSDISTTLANFAISHNVTQVFLGRTLQSGWKELFFRNIIEQVIRKISHVDVHVVADR